MPNRIKFSEMLIKIEKSFKQIHFKTLSSECLPFLYGSICSNDEDNPISHPIYLSVAHGVSRGHLLSAVLNTFRPRQNGRHFPEDIFKGIFLNENVRISIKISLKFVPGSPNNNFLGLVQMMAWRRPGVKPLSEVMMLSLLMHICVTRPRWVNTLRPERIVYHVALSNVFSRVQLHWRKVVSNWENNQHWFRLWRQQDL